MERGSIRGLLMFGLVVGMVGGQSTASFMDCYTKCFIFCVITPNNSVCSCSFECLKDCLIPSHPLETQTLTDTSYFCQLGCASSLCSNLSTKNNPAGEKVERCVNSCSNKCTDYHHPSPDSKTQQFSSAKP